MSSETMLHNLTAPLLSSSFVQAIVSSNNKTSPISITPSAYGWTCCHCLWAVSATEAQNFLEHGSCEHCDHDRCGLCDTLFYAPAAVKESVSGSPAEGLLYHLDEGQKQMKEKMGLAGKDEKGTWNEWTLGRTGVGAGGVLAVGTAVAAAGVAGAVALTV